MTPLGLSAPFEPEAKFVRILHVIGSVDPASGGPIEGVIRQHQAQSGLGAREVLTLDSPNAPFIRDCPLVVHAMGPATYEPAGRSRFKRFGYTPRLVPWLKAHVRDYDVVVVNGLWNYSSVGASQVLPDAGVPYFVFSHGMMDPWFRRTYPFKHLQKQLSWLAWEGRLVRGAKALLFTTEEEKQLAEGQFWGHGYTPLVAGYGTARPPSPTPEQAAAFRERHPGDANRPYFLFMSRIHQKKGIDLLIEAFGRCAAERPDLDLVIAGPDRDNMVSAFREQSRALGVEQRIHWVGMLSGDAKWGALYGAEAYILPSHQENFGISVAEALGCGAPVLITDKINIWREIKAASAGLVEPDTLDGVERLLRQAFALSPEERARMGQAGKAAFAEHFDVQVSAVRLYGLFMEASGKA